MNLEFNKPITIYRKDFNGKPSYQFMLSRKTQEGNYENAFMGIKFKGDVNIENKSKIKPKSAFLTFSKYQDKTTIYVMCMDYDKVEELPNEITSDNLPF